MPQILCITFAYFIFYVVQYTHIQGKWKHMQSDFNQSLKTVEQLRSIKIIVGDSALKNEQQIAKTHIDLHQLLYAIRSGKLGELSTSNIDKAHRPVISQSTIYARPKQQNAHYLSWSGFQPIDLDFKYNELIPYLKCL